MSAAPRNHSSIGYRNQRKEKMKPFLIIKKRLLSHTKSRWDFDDYPIRTWKNPNAGEIKVAYGAGIINWSLMVGHGETKKKAIEDLKEKFKLYKDNHQELPRPGTKVPIKFATTEQIDKYEDIAVDFFNTVLNMNYHEGFYSDGSSLPLFEPLEEEQARKTRDEIINRTLLRYSIDITDIYDGPLYIIFKKIKDRSR